MNPMTDVVLGCALADSIPEEKNMTKRQNRTAGPSLFMLHSLAACLAIAATTAHASDYPNRPIRLIVPFAAGGATDVAARSVASGMASYLGQPIVVENRAGAAGALAANYVAKAPADGYVLCFCATGPIIIIPQIDASIPYDPQKELIPVTQVLTYENVMVARNGLPANTLAELVQLARNKPGTITYATPGLAGTNHLAAEWLQQETGIQLLHIPYRGESAAIPDLISGQVDLLMGSPMLTTPFIREGKLKAIAMLDHQRSKTLLPEVPTIAESGYPNYAISNFVGIHAPRGTPPEIVDRVVDAVKAAVSSSAVNEKLRGMGLEPVASTREEYVQFLESEENIWRNVLSHVSITKQ